MSVSNPKITLNILAAETISSNQPQRVLLVGQMTSAGTSVSGELVSDIQNDGSANDLFGDNSMLAEMVRAFKRVNTVSRLDAIPLDDNGAGVAAEGEVNFSGSPTATGELIFSIGSSVNHSYTIAVSLSSTATSLATALAAAINADTQAPVTATSLVGAVTITAVNAGTAGNSIGIKVVGSVAGILAAIAEMTGGLTNPVLTGLFAPVAGLRYQTIVYPSEYTLTVLTTDFLDQRFNVNNNVLDGVGIICKTDTFANLKTLGNSSNSQSLGIIGNLLVDEDEYNGGAIFELTYVIATYFAAVRALRFTQDANLGQYVIGGQSRDQFGGPGLASLPYFNTPFYFLPTINQGNEFTQDEIDELGDTSVSVLGNNITNTLIIAGAIYTAYKTDAGGNPDPTYKYMEYVDTISNIREFMFNNSKRDFRQSRLTQGDFVPNRKMQNAISIGAVFAGYYKVLSGEDFALVQAGEPAIQFFKNNLRVSLDLSLGKVTISMKVPIVTQLREIIATLQIAFSTNS